MERRLLFSRLLLGLTIIAVLSALLTAVPFGPASEKNILGYHSFCTFTPVSTILCLMLANILYGIRKRKFLF